MSKLFKQRARRCEYVCVYSLADVFATRVTYRCVCVCVPNPGKAAYGYCGIWVMQQLVAHYTQSNQRFMHGTGSCRGWGIPPFRKESKSPADIYFLTASQKAGFRNCRTPECRGSYDLGAQRWTILGSPKKSLLLSIDALKSLQITFQNKKIQIYHAQNHAEKNVEQG